MSSATSASTAVASKALFITGTDTGVGKTMVTCAIARALTRRGIRVGVYKPVETGCSTSGHDLLAEDAERLIAAAGGRQPSRAAITYRFELPAAPLVAAAAIGRSVEPSSIVADYERVMRDYDFVLVEGAGGLLVPIAENFTYLDLARGLALPVLCVVGSRLGCINHALLTLRMLLYGGLGCVGYAMNVLEPGNGSIQAAESNRRTIARFTGARSLGIFPFVPVEARDDWDRLGTLADEHLDLGALSLG